MNEAAACCSPTRSAGTTSQAGWTRPGDPSSIDTWAGIATPKRDEGKKGPWSCGFVGGALDTGTDSDGVITRGANSGACYVPDSTRSDDVRAAARFRRPYLPGHRAASSTPKRPAPMIRRRYVDFGQLKRPDYVSPIVIKEEVGSKRRGSRGPPGTYIGVPLTDLRARRFRGQVVVEEAIEWILSPATQDQPLDGHRLLRDRPHARDAATGHGAAQQQRFLRQPKAQLLPARPAARTHQSDDRGDGYRDHTTAGGDRSRDRAARRQPATTRRRRIR